MNISLNYNDVSNTKNKNIFINNAIETYNYESNPDGLVEVNTYCKNINYNAKSFFVIHPFQVIGYLDGNLYEIEEKNLLFTVKKPNYPIDTGLIMLSFEQNCENETNMYVASLEEINAYTIPLEYYISDDGGIDFECPYKVHEVKSDSIINEMLCAIFSVKPNKNLKILFDSKDINRKYLMNFLPLIGILHEFLHLQEDYVHEYFLKNILDLLNDAKEMLHLSLSDKEKFILINDTYNVLRKLKDSINDVSKYNYSQFKDINQAIDDYYKAKEIQEKEEAEKKVILLEQEKQKLKQQEEESNKKKEEYIRKIASTSELLDYFNYKPSILNDQN